MTDQQPNPEPANPGALRPDPFGLVPDAAEMTRLRSLVEGAVGAAGPGCVDWDDWRDEDTTTITDKVMTAVGPVFARLQEKVQEHQTSSDYQVGWDDGVLACTKHHQRTTRAEQ